jgi:hypothetical protein
MISIITDQKLYNSRKRLPQELKERWIEALESGKYKQGRINLKFEYDDYFEYCCLGVLCEITNVQNTMKERTCYFDGFSAEIAADELLPYIENFGQFQGFIVEQVGIYYKSLSYMNDAGVSFKEIAKIIQKHF